MGLASAEQIDLCSGRTSCTQLDLSILNCQCVYEAILIFVPRPERPTPSAEGIGIANTPVIFMRKAEACGASLSSHKAGTNSTRMNLGIQLDASNAKRDLQSLWRRLTDRTLARIIFTQRACGDKPMI